MKTTWRQRLAATLEWSPVDKSIAISCVLILILAGYLLGNLYTRTLPYWPRLLRDGPSDLLCEIQAGLIAGAGLIIATGFALRRRWPDILWLQRFAVHYYALSLVISSYFIGTMNMATGVVLLGGPVFGFIFLDRRAVWSATVVSTLLLLGLSYATSYEILPYAPVVLPPTDAFTNRWWMTTTFLFAAPHFIVILLLADQTVHFWRNREDTIRTLSLTDTLTGLANRRSIMDLLDKEVARTRRHGPPMCVALLDLDHFKKINDTYGHPVGDQVLQEAARVLRASIRQCDGIGRYGGEEFMLILPDTDADGAALVLERCRTALATTLIRTSAGKAFNISASFGLVANERNLHLDAETLIRLADDALYRAKQGGRNRVEMMVPEAA